MTTSYAEKYIVELLVALMPGLDAQLRKQLFSHNGGALASFGARTDMAKALGLIDAKIYATMKALAAIRNRFAHDLSIVDCDDAEVEKYIGRMRGVLRMAEPNARSEARLDAVWINMSNSMRFAAAATNVCMSIHNSHARLERYRAAKPS